MKGLLIKEAISLRSQVRTLALFTLLYIAIAYFTKDTAILETMMYVVALMLVVSSFTYDKMYNWDHYALATPVGRNAIVYSKYLLSLLLTIPVALLVMVMRPLLVGGDFDLSFTLGAVSAILLMHAIFIPLLFKFGPEKARIALTAVFLVPWVLVMLFIDDLKAFDFTQAWVQTVLRLMPLVGLAAFAVSTQVSLAIYKKKQF